jgi:hypothetical protein
MTRQLRIDSDNLDADIQEAAEEEAWRREWQGMPEFVQEAQPPYAKIVVRFASKEDLDDFMILIGQKLTNKTKSIWHPHKSHWGNGHATKRWVDEDEADG